MEDNYQEYVGAKIVSIEQGKNERSHITYAQIRSANDRLLLSATLEYCVERMKDAAIWIRDNQNV